MRSPLFWLSLICLSAIARAATPSQTERNFLTSLHLGAKPQVHYLDDVGRSLDYAAFAQQLWEGHRSYSITRDDQAGMAVLRLRPSGAHAGEPGRFAFGRGDTFPPFELPSLRGGVRRLRDFRGHYTLLSFFFAECAPCVAEVPALNAYAHAHGDMNFVAITYEGAATGRRFASEHGLTWPVLYNGQSLIDTLGVSIYPTLMLIDPSSHVAGAAVGMSMQDNETKRVTDLGIWIEQWKRMSRASATQTTQ